MNSFNVSHCELGTVLIKKKMDRDIVSLMESYFDFIYSKAIALEMRNVVKKLCEGCHSGNLSQTKHACLTLSDGELLELYFEEIVKAVDENTILQQWEESVKCIDNISEELIYMYKLKLFCKDWRETDMKTERWRQTMIKRTLQILQLETRFSSTC